MLLAYICKNKALVVKKTILFAENWQKMPKNALKIVVLIFKSSV
jgi:hypothetical protein